MKKLYMTFILFSVGYAFGQNYTTNFETSTNRVWIDSTATDSLWQIGVPQKTTFDSAYSVSNAIITDTVNPYPDSAEASFFLEFELGGANPYVEFYHRYDTESGHAGGVVEISLDAGHNWLPLYHGFTLDPMMDTVFDYTQSDFWAQMFFVTVEGDWPAMNDTLPNGKPAFQGTSNGWMHSTIQFGCMALKMNQDYLLRFTFHSDSSTNYVGDGWMIDNIFTENSSVCSSIEEFNIISKVYPNPAQESIYLELESTMPNITIQIVDILGTSVFEKEYNHTNFVEIEKDLPAGTYQVFVLSDGEVIGRSQLIGQ